MQPVNVFPPHCPYLATGPQLGCVATGALLVSIVVGAADVGGAADVAGAPPPLFPPPVLPPPLLVPSHTAGPGIGYEVAVLAASESMLNAMPGSVPL